MIVSVKAFPINRQWHAYWCNRMTKYTASIDQSLIWMYVSNKSIKIYGI